MVFSRMDSCARLSGAILGLATLAVCCSSLAAFAKEPAGLDLTLTPHAANGAINRLDVHLRIEKPAIAAGQALLKMPRRITSIPTASYDAAAFDVHDDAGPLKLQQVDDPTTPSIDYRHWNVDRATVGDVVVRYGTAPRQVSSATRNGPLFDLRADGDGVIGAGVYFLALPANEDPYRISQKWDMSAVPAGTRGIWSLGEGNQNVVLPAEELDFTFYMVGIVKSYPADGKGNFGFYWLAPPPFDVEQISSDVAKLYAYMSKFFHDEDGQYRVFVRGNPYKAGGGTALTKSFLFGYGADGSTISGGIQMLLAHEMAHNWPMLSGAEEDHAGTSWYSEGTAEYYSARLSVRAGALSVDKFLDVVNEHAENYYTNPYRELSNQDAGKKYWSTSDAQRVPYGRGFMYLTNVDAEMRMKSHGVRSLDDLVLKIYEDRKVGKTFGLMEWRALVVKELGEAAGSEYDEMVAGKLIVPAADAMAPCFHAVHAEIRPFELGYDDMQLGLVKDLIPDSAAARAGVQNGDVVTSFTRLDALRKDENKMMELKVQRGGKELSIDYLPRKAAVSAWRWVRTSSAENAACSF